MFINLYALSKEALNKMVLTVESVAQHAADTTPRPAPKVNTGSIAFGAKSGLSAAFGHVVSPTASSPVESDVQIIEPPFAKMTMPKLTIEGTIYDKAIQISGLPDHININDIRDGLKTHSLVLHEGSQGYEVMDLETASVKYDRAFATRAACEITGEDFNALREEYDFFDRQAEASQEKHGIPGVRPGGNSGR